jgi:hypothetical protein
VNAFTSRFSGGTGTEAFRRHCVEVADATYANWVVSSLENRRDKRSPGERIADAVLAVRDRELSDLRHEVERRQRRIVAAEALLRDLVDPDPCVYDHNGGCQAHGWLQGRCAHARARALLDALPHEPGPAVDSEPVHEFCAAASRQWERYAKHWRGRAEAAESRLDDAREQPPAARQDAETLHEMALKDVPHVSDAVVADAVDEWHRRSGEGYPLDDVLRHVLAPLAAKVADYESGICWDTTCTSCARHLDGMRFQEERAERVEAAAARVRALTGLKPHPDTYGQDVAAYQAIVGCTWDEAYWRTAAEAFVAALDADDEPAPIRFGEQENDGG